MPKPVNEKALVPAGFDPAIHCGATSRGGMLCTRPAGWGVTGIEEDERKSRRCKMHGGQSNGRPIEHGLYSERFRSSFLERVEQIRQDPSLRQLDTEIAVAKAAMEKEITAYESESETYETLYEAYLLDPVNVAAPRAPRINTEILETIGRLVKTDHDIVYGKRYSIPIRDVQVAFAQIQSVFDDVCKRFGISEDAKQAFAKGLMNVKLPDAALGEESAA